MAWNVGAGLEGKGVIVTGAAGGIGRAVAQAFSTTGARVMAVDLDQARVDEVVDGLEGSGHVGAAMDLADLAGHQPLVDRARSELGGLYVLANLAAVLRRRGSLAEITEEDWDFQHGINLKAAFFRPPGPSGVPTRLASGLFPTQPANYLPVPSFLSFTSVNSASTTSPSSFFPSVPACCCGPPLAPDCACCCAADTCRKALCEPCAVGEYVMVTVHIALAASVLPVQVSFDFVNWLAFGPCRETLMVDDVPPPVLLTVNITGVDEVPVCSEPKYSKEGDTSSWGPNGALPSTVAAALPPLIELASTDAV